MNDLPARKNIRLKGYDYSQNAAYFITICIKDRRELLGKIVGDAIVGDAIVGDAIVGDAVVGDAVLSVPFVELSNIGLIVKEYLTQMTLHLECAKLENYVIMPNHVHLLVLINDVTKNGTSGMSGTSGTLRTASPTTALIPRIVHGMKAVTTKKVGYTIWQRSYHDHIIRNETEYLKVWQYIDENPSKWTEDRYYYI